MIMKLRKKVIFANMIIITLVLVISSPIIVATVDNANLHAVYQYLLRQSNFSQQYLAEYLKTVAEPSRAFEYNRLTLEKMLEDLSGCEVTVTSIADEKVFPIQEYALSGKKTYLIETTGDVRKFYLSFPVYMNGGIVGAVTFEQPLYREDAMKRGLILVLAIIFTLALLVSLVLSLVFSRRLIKPLELLTRASEKFSEGNFEPVALPRTRDELRFLTDSFNNMGRNIGAMLQKLRNEQEKQKNFIDNVTHEIRTPLTNILGYVDLAGRVADEDKRQRYYSYIKSEGERLLDMVNNLLELSRLNKYDLSANREKTDVTMLVMRVIELMKHRAESSDIKIIPDLGQVTADVDADKVKQVLLNLMDNALKYSEGKQITVRLWKEDKVYLSVSDDGRGIPEEDIPHVAEPFYRSDKSRSRKLGGSGLGLAVCREIARAHDGELLIESRKGEGTTVTISLQG